MKRAATNAATDPPVIVRGGEARPVRRARFKAIHAQCAPVAAIEIPREQIPAPTRGDEAVGFDAVSRDLTAGTLVVEAEDPSVTNRRRQLDECLGRHGGRARVTRAGRERGDRHAIESMPQPARQHLAQRGQRPHRALLDAATGEDAGLKGDRQGDRLVVVKKQRRQVGPAFEPVTAVGSGDRVDPVPQITQPIDVATHSPIAHPEPAGELSSRPVAAYLQQREQLQHSSCRFGHAVTVVRVTDTS